MKRTARIDSSKPKCSICDFKLSLESAKRPGSEEITYFDFGVRKEYVFWELS